MGCIPGRDKVGGKTDVAKWNVEIVHDGLGEAPHQCQALIVPFVLLSALSGQLADAVDKARIIRIVKLC